MMTDRIAEEYAALRATIRSRGTARVCIFGAGLAVWAALLLVIFTTTAVPISTLVPLLFLAGTFEAVFSLHVGVERIGRYLQVFHDDAWEHTAMAFGRPLAGTGADPLFAAIFGLAAIANVLPVLIVGPTMPEVVGLGAFHAAFLLRLATARRAASRQRAADLERFKALKNAN